MNCKAIAVSKSGRTLKTLLTAIVVFASIITGMAQVPNYVPANGLVGWWPFNGNANDESGNGNNGTINGATLTADRNGNANAAYSFDGLTNTIDLGNSQSYRIQNQLTISVWILINGGTQNPRIIQFGNNNFDEFGLETQGTSNSTRVVNGFFGGFPANSSISCLTWHHVVYTCNRISAESKIYFDGNLMVSNNGTPGSPLNYGACNLKIGEKPCGNSDYWGGKIDDIGIWNRALTQQEITNLYTSSTPPPCNPLAANLMNGLVGYWPFCGNANDESGNGNNGTVTGATLTSDRNGNANSAYSFDPTNNSNILVPFSPSLNTIQNGITMSAWIYMDGGTGPSTPPRILELRGGFGNGGDAGFVMLAQNNSNVSRTLEVKWYNNNGTTNISILPSPLITALAWHHVVYACDGITGVGNLYVDGVFLASNAGMSQQGNISLCNYNNNPLIIGSETNSLGNWGGYLDDIAIWNRALTQNEITQLYTGSPCVNYQVITVTDTLIINANLTSVNPVTFQNAIKVYPNPSSTQITIDFGANYTTMAGYTMRIQNAVGQIVYTTGVTQQQFTSNLSTWTGNGIYFVYLIDAQGNTVDVKKIILQ
jgi:hypothetical protein